MEIEVLKEDKNEIEFRIENLTIAEILRVYLNKDSTVIFAAWKRENLTKFPIMKVKASKDVKKAISKAVEAILKDLDCFETDFNKLK